MATIIPGAHPLDELETALLRMAAQPAPTLLDQLTADERGIGRCVRRVLPEDDDELVLVIDQFEELYTVTDAARRTAFLAGVAAAVSDERGALTVVITLRADFIDRPLLDPVIGALIRDNAVLVTPLGASELRQAITGPAERIGMSVDVGLVAELVSESAGQPGSLPLLQYALTQTYEAREGSTLSLEAYQRAGGLTGALTKRADQLYEDLPPERRPAVRRLFTRLITIGEGSEVTRRRVRRSELAGVTTDVVDAYGRARLLSFDRDPTTREPTVEIAHEALISEWPRLRGWLEEDRDGLRILRHLGAAAQAWEAAGRDDGELYRGGRLETAEDWVASHPGEPNAVEQAFLVASSNRRAREAATERRRLHRLRALLLVTAMIATVAVIAGVVAFRQRAETDDARAETDLRRLVAESANQIESDRRLGLLMAVEAARLDPSPQTLGAIQRVLVNSPTNWLGSLSGVVPYGGAAFLDDATLLAVSPAGLDVWDLDARAITQTVELAAEAGQLAVSDDRRRVAVGHHDGSWEVLDAATFAVVKEGAVGSTVFSIAMNADGSQVAIGGVNGVATVSDVDGGAADRIIDRTLRVDDLAFDPSGDLLAIGTGGFGDVVVIDATTGEPSGPGVINVGAELVAWHERGLFVARDHAASVLDPLTGQPVLGDLQLLGNATVVSRSGSVDGGVVVLSGEGTIERLAADGVAVEVKGADPQIGDVQAIALDPAGAIVAAVGSAGVSLTSMNGLGTLAVRTLPTKVDAVELSEDGTVAMTSASGSPIEVWALDDPARSPETVAPYLKPLNRDDTFYLVGETPSPTGGAATPVRALWHDGSLAPVTAGPDAFSITYALSPDGDLLVVDNGHPDSDQIVTVIDRSTDEVVARLDAIRRDDDVEGHLPFAADIEFSPDGRLLVITTWRGGVHFYDTQTWTPRVRHFARAMASWASTSPPTARGRSRSTGTGGRSSYGMARRSRSSPGRSRPPCPSASVVRARHHRRRPPCDRRRRAGGRHALGSRCARTDWRPVPLLDHRLPGLAGGRREPARHGHRGRRSDLEPGRGQLV